MMKPIEANPILQEPDLRNAIEDVRFAGASASAETRKGKHFAKHLRKYKSALLRVKGIFSAWIYPPPIPEELIDKYNHIPDPDEQTEEEP